jgi:hypothetical protein
MAYSTLQRILEVLQERLRSMTFSPQPGDPCQPIHSRNIVVWKQKFAATEGEESLPHVETPGLVITPPKTIRAPADLGTNARDDVIYPVAVQLVDSDGQERVLGLPSYLKWLEQIRRACHARSWPEVEIATYGDVYASFAEVTDTLDPKVWTRHQKFVAAVAIAFFVREQRGIEL